MVDALRKRVNKSDWRDTKTAISAVKDGPDSVKLDPKDGNDPLRGGRYAPPPGYTDAYKKFTTDAAKGGSDKK